MRILVLIHEYPPVGGGGGRVAQDLCLALSERGHEIKVLTTQCPDLPEIEESPNLTIYRLRTGRKETYRASLMDMARFVGQSILKGIFLIRSWKPDIIHVHFAVPAGAPGWLLSKLFGVPYVLTVHLGDVPGGVPEKTGKWFKWIFPFTPPIWQGAAAVIAVSEFTRSLALQNYHVPVNVIPNGVDLREIDPGEITLNKPLQIVFAGRFMPQKNLLGLVRILDSCKDLPWQAALIGDGPLRPAVEQEVAKRGLDDRIQMTGWISTEEVLNWYQQSDIMLLPSLSEGLPVVGVQGAAMGLALLLSRVGGNIDLVPFGENGELVDVGDEAGFSSSLRKMLTHPDLLLEQRRKSRLLAGQFDLAKVVSDYEAVFTSLVN